MSYPFGLLSTAEQASTLAKALPTTMSEQAQSLGMRERYWYGHRRGEMVHPASAANINQEYRGQMFVFWSSAADMAVQEIRNERNLTKLYNVLELGCVSEFEGLLAINPSTVQFTDINVIEANPQQDYFGRTYRWAIYRSRMARYRNSIIDRPRMYDEYFQLMAKVEAYLDQLDESDPTVKMLRFKTSWDQFIMRFEKMSPEEKSGSAWREELQASGFFATVEAYNDQIPFAWPFPFNALAFASRLNMTERYQGLVDRLLRTKEFSSVQEITGHRLFDEDFDNVRLWMRSTIAAE